MIRKSETRTRQVDRAMRDVPTSITDEKQKHQVGKSIARGRRRAQGREDKKTRIIAGAEARQREDKRMRRIAAAGWIF